jgi:hypothetical protein
MEGESWVIYGSDQLEGRSESLKPNRVVRSCEVAGWKSKWEEATSSFVPIRTLLLSLLSPLSKACSIDAAAVANRANRVEVNPLEP